MPTYAFTRTREDFVNSVLRKIGAIGAGQTASEEDVSVVNEALDLRLKEFHARNLLWFKVAGAQSDLVIVSGTATVSAESDVLYPISVAIRVNGEDEPVQVVGHRQFQTIPNKTDAGQPEMVLFSGGVFRFWPVPDANYTGKLTYQQIAADSAGATAPDIQVPMMRSLKNLVAYDLADDFAVPDNLFARLKTQADAAEKMILAINQERVDSAPVTPEYF